MCHPRYGASCSCHTVFDNDKNAWCTCQTNVPSLAVHNVLTKDYWLFILQHKRNRTRTCISLLLVTLLVKLYTCSLVLSPSSLSCNFPCLAVDWQASNNFVTPGDSRDKRKDDATDKETSILCCWGSFVKTFHSWHEWFLSGFRARESRGERNQFNLVSLWDKCSICLYSYPFEQCHVRYNRLVCPRLPCMLSIMHAYVLLKRTSCQDDKDWRCLKESRKRLKMMDRRVKNPQKGCLCCILLLLLSCDMTRVSYWHDTLFVTERPEDYHR